MPKSEQIRKSLLRILNASENKSLKSTEAYLLIARDLNVDCADLNKVYDDGDFIFNTNVQAAVEILRKQGKLIRGGERGVWTLKSKVPYVKDVG